MVPYKHRDLLILIAENHNCNRIRTHNDLFCKKMLNHLIVDLNLVVVTFISNTVLIPRKKLLYFQAVS